MATKRTSSPEFTIGSDPEMIFTTKEGELIKAGDILTKADKFGVDGHAYIAELRPEPAVSPRDLVINLSKLFKTKSDKLEKFRWLAGPWVHNKPLGGHIHFGVDLEDRYVDALDSYLGIVLAVVEPHEMAKVRRTSVFYGDKPYGMLSDVREKKWGFEYRTPSSFIVTPGASLGIMSLAKAIIHEELLGTPSAWSKIPSKVRTELKYSKEDFYECKRKVFLPKLNTLWSLFRGMRYFTKGFEGESLWSAVAYLRNKVINSEGYNPDRDIKISWRLLPENPVPPKNAKQQDPLILDPQDFPREVMFVKLNTINYLETIRRMR